jgi:hypothetical protein
MAITGILANSIFLQSAGAIVSNTGTLTHKFGPSSIWGHPGLQAMAVNDSDGSANAIVSQFTDATGTHNVSSIGQFADKCTSITYRLTVGDSFTRALCITEFFG